MFKESLICIIVAIVTYQIYLDFKKKSKSNLISNQEKKKVETPVEIQPQKPMNYDTPNTFIHPQLGKPDKIISEGYLFIIENPNPWNAIIFNQSKQEKYLFILKINNKSKYTKNFISNLEKWKSIIPQFIFNIESGEIMIPQSDEDVALALANLILSNFSNQLEFDNIVKNNLINISINKIKSHSSVRKKIIEQILENISEVPEVLLNHNVDYEEDLAETATNIPEQNQSNEDDKNYLAYEGIEYSYLN